MNDLISRQAVLDAIKKTHWFTVQADSNAGYPCGTIDDIVSLNVHMDIDAVRRAVNDVPAFSGWISVKDRLPEVDKPILYCAFGRSVGEGVYRGFDGVHHVWNMYAVSGTHWDNEVTHWMPLPEPPKEENDAE